MYISEKRTLKSEVKDNTYNPKWDEEFKFLVHARFREVGGCPDCLAKASGFNTHGVGG